MNLPSIVIVLASDPRAYGGEEIQTLGLIEGLRERFNFLLVVAGEGPFAEEARARGTDVRTIPMREMGTYSAVSALASLLRERGAQIVQTLDIRSNFLGRLAARRAKVPAVITTRHEMYFSSGFSFRKKVRRFLYLILDRLTAHLSDRFIAVSEAIASELVRLERVPQEKIVVIHNGVDLGEINGKVSAVSAENIRKDLGLSESRLVVGSVGRIIVEKGYEILVRSAAKVVATMPEVCFLIVGEGPGRLRLEKLVEELNLKDKFRFLGFRRDGYDLMTLFDVFVLPSLHEGFPLTVLEAMALSKPVVATSVGGIPEIVVDNKSGILVPPRDPEALADAVTILLQDKAKATEMGKQGRRIVEERFTAERMLKETERVYSQLLHSGM